MKGISKLLGMILAVIIVICSVPYSAHASEEGAPENEGTFRNSGTMSVTLSANTVQYLDETGTENSVNCQSLTDSLTSLSSGWYVAEGDISIGSRISVNGDVHLILADNCHLNVNGGICVNKNNSLAVYAQSTGDQMGKLTAAAASGAGIGSDCNNDSGTVTINGGNITATGGVTGVIGGAGIGSGGTDRNGGTAGLIVINSGNITAKGGTGSFGAGAGIGGGGQSSHASEIRIQSHLKNPPQV